MDGKYRALVIDDTKDFDILETVKVAEEIKLQYGDASGGDDNLRHIELAGTIARLEYRIEIISSTVDALKVSYNQDLAGTLKDLGIKRTVTPENLDDVLVEAKKFELELGKLRKEQDEIRKIAERKPTKPTRKMFDKILAEIDPKLQACDITTERFCTLYNKLKDKAKAIEKANNGFRKGK